MAFVITVKRLVSGTAPAANVAIEPDETGPPDDRWTDPTLELRREFLVRWDDESESRPTAPIHRGPVSMTSIREDVAAGSHRPRVCRRVR